LTLSLGIGANTAVFSVVNAALLRPLPFDRPEELVQIKTDSKMLGISPHFYGESAFLAFRKNAQTLSEIAAYSFWD
jgi:hypothetical protein